jgi:hypothetical protein
LRASSALAPTLTHINSRNARRSNKRVKQDSTGHPTTTTYNNDLTLSLGDRHPLSSLDDSSNPFGEDVVADPLSSSFKSLYKSIFGHSVSSGEYLNPPPLPPSVLTDLGTSDTTIPLGGSALSLLGTSIAGPTHSASNYCPHFYTLMDSFRDIAESNSWDKLEPEQVHVLMQSFKAVERDRHRLGLDDESYSRVSSSFEQFLQQLSCRFVSDSSGDESVGRDHNVADLADYHPNIPGSGGSAAQPLVDSLPPTYPENPEMFPISGTSPPSSINYCPQHLTIDPPSPTPRPSSREHVAPHHTDSDNTHTTQLFPSSSGTHDERREFKFLRPSSATFIHMERQTKGGDHTTATHPMDPFGNYDDDEFDWSTIM